MQHSNADVERHYDAQASLHVSRSAALATRRSGALYVYKKHANAVKRRMIEEFAGNASLLVDLGCGRGGDINKWKEARIRQVIALDLSAAQLDEARRRNGQDPSRQKTLITWLHASMMQPDLLEFLRPHLAAAAGASHLSGADAVCAQFAIQYAFGSEEVASRTLGVAASLLRAGGVFFGVAPDASAILELLSKGDAGTGEEINACTAVTSSECKQLHLQPPQHPFSLLLKLLGGGEGGGEGGGGGGGGGGGESAEFGSPLLFSLEDTVTAGSEAEDASEFLCFRQTMTRLAAKHGMRPVEIASLADASSGGKGGGGGKGGKGGGGKGGGGKGGGGLGPDERLVAGLYFTFAFVKDSDSASSSRSAAAAVAERATGAADGGARGGAAWQGHPSSRSGDGEHGEWSRRGDGYDRQRREWQEDRRHDDMSHGRPRRDPPSSRWDGNSHVSDGSSRGRGHHWARGARVHGERERSWSRERRGRSRSRERDGGGGGPGRRERSNSRERYQHEGRRRSRSRSRGRR